MIILEKEAENILNQFQDLPWSNLEAHLPDYDGREFGLLSPMLTPALRVYERFYKGQLMVEMAKASVSLERFYLKHGRYPEQLGARHAAGPNPFIMRERIRWVGTARTKVVFRCPVPTLSWRVEGREEKTRR